MYKAFSLMALGYMKLLFICATITALAPELAKSQMSYYVRPTRFYLQASPGESVASNVTIINRSSERQVLDIIPVWLVQTINGDVVIGQVPEDPLRTRQGAFQEWFQISEDVLTLDPYEEASIQFDIVVPEGARGTYLAGFVAQSRRTERGSSGVKLIVRFMIRFELEVVGPHVRKSLLARDPRVLTKSAGDDGTRSEYLVLSAVNDGDVVSGLAGQVTISRVSNDNTRRIGTFQVDEIRIYPESDILVSSQLPIRLGSGEYRLDFDIRSDGRRLPIMPALVEFEADEELEVFDRQSAITLTPAVLEVSSRGGARRSFGVSARNSGIDTVRVTLSASPISEISGKAIGTRRSDQVDASGFIELRRHERLIPPGREMRFTGTVELPKTELLPSYYASLVLESAFLDGQAAGEVTGLLAVNVDSIEGRSVVQFDRVSLSNVDGEVGSFVAEISNIGDRHAILEGELLITDLTRNRVIAKGEVHVSNEPLLPFGVRRLAGEFSLKGLPREPLFAVFKIQYGSDVQTTELRFRLNEIGGQLVLESL